VAVGTRPRLGQVNVYPNNADRCLRAVGGKTG
jgi:hypothetical protein